jgi:hypothetical protein
MNISNPDELSMSLPVSYYGHLMDLRWIRRHGRQAIREISPKLDVCRNRGTQQFERFPDKRGELENLPLQFLRMTERHHAPNQMSGWAIVLAAPSMPLSPLQNFAPNLANVTSW